MNSSAIHSVGRLIRQTILQCSRGRGLRTALGFLTTMALASDMPGVGTMDQATASTTVARKNAQNVVVAVAQEGVAMNSVADEELQK